MFHQEILRLDTRVSRFSLILMVSWHLKVLILQPGLTTGVKVWSESSSMKRIKVITRASMSDAYHSS